MANTDLARATLFDLRRAARQRGLRSYGRLSKEQLRAALAEQPRALARARNECDPISMEPLRYPFFEHPKPPDPDADEPGARTHGFDAALLARYMLSQDVFRNPITQEEFAAEDVARLDALLALLGARVPSLSDALRTSAERRRVRAHRRDTLLSLETHLCEALDEMLTLSSLGALWPLALPLLHEVLPRYVHHLDVIMSFDCEHALHVVGSHQSLVGACAADPSPEGDLCRALLVPLLQRLESLVEEASLLTPRARAVVALTDESFPSPLDSDDPDYAPPTAQGAAPSAPAPITRLRAAAAPLAVAPAAAH